MGAAHHTAREKIFIFSAQPSQGNDRVVRKKVGRLPAELALHVPRLEVQAFGCGLVE
jgi:hypothetical protein